MKFPNRASLARRGFSLIELIVVIMIMTVLAGVVIPRVVDHQKSARDARRLADIKALQRVIDQYYLENGDYPPGDTGGWNRSTDGAGFISVLVNEGYLTEPVEDPINDNTYHYRYRRYNQGQFGCVGDGRFYVLGVRNFESTDFANEHPGFFRCTGNDFSTAFDYVTGGGASFQ